MDYPTPEEAVEAGKGLTFEKVWTAIMESNQRMEDDRQKAQQETNRILADIGTKLDKSVADIGTKLDKSVADIGTKLDKSLGGFGNTLGKITEALLSAEMWKKFHDLGFEFERQAERVKFAKGKRVIAEADVFMENGEYAMIAEVKTTLTNDDINSQLRRIGRIREHMDARNDDRKLVGAVAASVVPENVLEYAHSKGLYVVIHSGDATTIAALPFDFQAREW